MKILILTEGGQKIGFGHITRCIAICEAFEERKINPIFIINGDDSILPLMKGKNYKILNWIENKEKLFNEIGNSDFIIVDSYLAGKNLYDKISDMFNGKVLMLDDYNRVNYPKGIVVNPSIYGDKLNYKKKKNSVYLLGKDYIILRKEFWNVPNKRINKKVKDVLITFGGINKVNFTEKISNFFRNKFDIDFHIVSKNNSKTAKEMLDLIIKSDICISGGGQTLNELARVGVPTIGICFADNQLWNLMGWEKVEFLKFAGWFNDKFLIQKIEKYIIKSHYNARSRMSRMGKQYIDGEGYKRVIKEILKKI